MYWFSQRGENPLSSTQRAHLALESCEPREAPSALSNLLQALMQNITVVPPSNGSTAKVVVNVPAGSNNPTVPRLFRSFVVFNQAPQIVNFQAVVGSNGQVTFSGQVIDDQNTTGDTVTITGNGIDLTTTVDTNGNFSVTTTVNATGDIVVTATVTDVFGNTSAQAFTMFTPSPVGTGDGDTGPGGDGDPGPGGDGGPQIGLSPVLSNVVATLGEGGIVTITGTVADDVDPTGHLVQLQGSGVDTVTIVGEDNTFSTSFQRPSNAELTIRVKVIDNNGNASNEEIVLVPGV